VSTPVTVEVWFDYTCPFAYRACQWLDQLAVGARWRPFSLLERNYRGHGPPVWRLPERVDDISLLLFAGHQLVAAGRGDLDRYRRSAFTAWHQTRTRLGLADVVRFAADAGAAGAEAAVRAHFFDAEAEHEAARARGVFGSPTLVFGPDRAAFVKLDRVPAPDRAGRVFDAVLTLSEFPSVLEVKRPQAPDTEAPSPAPARVSLT
jgi:2-hydroxychromene-2-carboxylate isomerase